MDRGLRSLQRLLVDIAKRGDVGKLYANERPGLGVTLDTKPLTLIGEVTQSVQRQIYSRPDGSLTHW